MLKIIAGEFRSRRLLSPPDGETTRPYLTRVRVSVFDMLREWFEDASVLDLFAGVGTIGLEAVSRGARAVLMVEQDRGIHELLQKNIRELGCGDRAVAMLGDALGSACLLRAEPPVDLVFVDPPYSLMREEPSRQRVLGQIAQCRSIMAVPGFVILRSPLSPEAVDQSIPGFRGPEAHRYRPDLWVLIYEQVAAEDGGDGGDLPTSSA